MTLLSLLCLDYGRMASTDRAARNDCTYQFEECLVPIAHGRINDYMRQLRSHIPMTRIRTRKFF